MHRGSTKHAASITATDALSCANFENPVIRNGINITGTKVSGDTANLPTIS
ncbi:MAG: hypothetical protein IJR85_10080 [Synergistaceae bacterium]|nr:hypothetical protein [Synergistaceae bacterium]